MHKISEEDYRELRALAVTETIVSDTESRKSISYVSFISGKYPRLFHVRFYTELNEESVIEVETLEEAIEAYNTH